MKVTLVSTTQVEQSYVEELADSPDATPAYLEMLRSPEALMIHCARVSSPKQMNPSFAGLLKYCIENEHWSVLEMADATFEIVTSRGLSPQFLRHRSCSFQEFSLRYAPASAHETYRARRQDRSNRQNSIDDLPEAIQVDFLEAQEDVWNFCYERYQKALAQGVAKECARFLLPLSTQTRFFMKGSIRSWVHYLSVRDKAGTQEEHKEIAQAIKTVFIEKFPVVSAAMGWADGD